jgi:hypothetical protein
MSEALSVYINIYNKPKIIILIEIFKPNIKKET